MKWILKQKNIFDEPADVLVCSANIYLNLSGGVGGELLLRYGSEIQRELHGYLEKNGLNHVEQGTVVATPPCGSPYKKIMHAVAVNAFYESSADIVERLVYKCLQESAKIGAKTVALTALATGYGRMDLRDFLQGISKLVKMEFPPVENIVICVRRDINVMRIKELIPEIHVLNGSGYQCIWHK